MLYDPIQAFLGGITSTFARIVLVLMAFLLALLAYYLGHEDFNLAGILLFPFAALWMIFVWGASGIFFPIGLLSGLCT
jgi:hypothetical protein